MACCEWLTARGQVHLMKVLSLQSRFQQIVVGLGITQFVAFDGGTAACSSR